MNIPVLGFSNTVDYEIEWNTSHIEFLIRSYKMYEKDIAEKKKIRTMKDLLASVLFHMREGSGCGLLTETPDVIEAFIRGTKYQVALGGTNLRAADIIAALGGTALVHLVSMNEDTLKKMPCGVSYVGGREFPCCFPHIALQFPKGVCIEANDIRFITPRENRVIYSGDIACAEMPLDKEFFTRAAGAGAVLLSGFDLIREESVLKERLWEIRQELTAFLKKPLIFYEHACFAQKGMENLVRKELGPLFDVYSMNEDEFQSLVGEKIDFLNEENVLNGLKQVHEKLPCSTVIIHTCHWTLASGKKAEEITEAMEMGMMTATTRYWKGKVDFKGIQKTRKQPVQKEAERFAGRIREISAGEIVCLPAVDVSSEKPTTVGLGDSFVGGFLYEYCFKNRKGRN